jgi:hypothetical protein
LSLPAVRAFLLLPERHGPPPGRRRSANGRRVRARAPCWAEFGDRNRGRSDGKVRSAFTDGNDSHRPSRGVPLVFPGSWRGHLGVRSCGAAGGLWNDPLLELGHREVRRRPPQRGLSIPRGPVRGRLRPGPRGRSCGCVPAGHSMAARSNPGSALDTGDADLRSERG